MSESGRSKTIKLFCPSLSKLVPLVALEDQRLDLGSIARTFGLDPPTLRLNGYFISRGVDLISSSVTWKSLLSFFSSRGLATGTNDCDALIVEGKLCKSGTKRAYSPSDGEIGDPQNTENNVLGTKRKPRLEDVDLKKKKKMDEAYSGTQNPFSGENGDHRTIKYNGLGVKRGSWLEDVIPLKKKKMDENNSGNQLNQQDEISNIQVACSGIHGSRKPEAFERR